MSSKKQPGPLQVLVGLALLAALVGLGTALLFALIDQAAELSPDVVATLIAGGFTVGGIVWSRRHERAQAIALDLRTQKAPIYTEFMDFWFQILLNPKVGMELPRFGGHLILGETLEEGGPCGSSSEVPGRVPS